MSKTATKTVEMPVEAVNNTAVTMFDGGDLAVGGAMPDYIAKDSARGNESMAADDIQIPRLEITQDLTPMVKAGDADVGQLYNSVTEELYGQRALFVPVMFIKQYLVWKERKAGGGFRGEI